MCHAEQDCNSTEDANKGEPACKQLRTAVEAGELDEAGGKTLGNDNVLKHSDDDEQEEDHMLFIFPRPTRLFFFVALFLSEAAFMENA